MLDTNIQQSLSTLSTTLIGDAHARLKFPENHLSPDIRPVIPFSKIVGTAITAILQPVATPDDADLSPMVELYESQDKESATIVVIQVPPELRCYGIFGDGAASMCRAHGIVGAIIDGSTRDTEALTQMQYPVFAKDRTPGYMPPKAKVASINQPVTIDGRTIRKDDVIVADNDGVMVIRPDKVEAVITRAKQIMDWEKKLHARYAMGMSCKQAIQEIGPLP